jgi:hypothetical protein
LKSIPRVSKVAYSIALESSVAAITLWDRPCHPHNFHFFIRSVCVRRDTTVCVDDIKPSHV